MKLHGWVIKKREHGKIIFIDLRSIEEPYHIFQIVCVKSNFSNEEWEKIKKITQESAITVEGEVKENERAPWGKEIEAKKIEIVSLTENYPLAKKEHGYDVLHKLNHLYIRGIKPTKIFVLRSYLVNYFTNFFNSKKWYYVSPPIIVRSACEGGATLFEMKWFENKKAFLSQSAQLYLEALIFSLGKVYSLTPSFRAEKSRTKRHLAEYWHLEGEAAFFRFDQLLNFQEEMIKDVVRNLLENEITKRIIEEFRGKEGMKILYNTVEGKFERIKYEEALQMLKEKGINLNFGDDLGSDEEKVISENFDRPFFITHYPRTLKAFYMYVNRENEKEVLAADLELPEGYGEVIGGSEREIDIRYLEENMKMHGLNEEEYQWYLDLRKYGNVPHSGFGLGIERFLAWLLRLDHVKYTLPFPRLPRHSSFI